MKDRFTLHFWSLLSAHWFNITLWDNSSCCESVNSSTQLLSQLNLLWVSKLNFCESTQVIVSQLSTCWVSLNQIPYIRYSDNSTTTDTFSLYRTRFYLYYTTYYPQSTWSKCKILPDTSCIYYSPSMYILLPLQIPSTGSLYIIHREA